MSYFEQFAMGPDASTILSVSSLRGSKEIIPNVNPIPVDDDYSNTQADRPLLGYTGRYRSGGGWGCNLCEVDDNDATSLEGGSAFASTFAFGDALTSFSMEHKLWEELFCQKARRNIEFSTMRGCTIVLSDCHVEEGDNVDGYGHATATAVTNTSVKTMVEQSRAEQSRV